MIAFSTTISLSCLYEHEKGTVVAASVQFPFKRAVVCLEKPSERKDIDPKRAATAQSETVRPRRRAWCDFGGNQASTRSKKHPNRSAVLILVEKPMVTMVYNEFFVPLSPVAARSRFFS